MSLLVGTAFVLQLAGLLQLPLTAAVHVMVGTGMSLTTTSRYLAALRSAENPHAEALATLLGLDTP